MLIYFQSKAGGDFLMLETHARTLIELIGKTFMPQGIFVAQDLASHIASLERGLLAHALQMEALKNNPSTSLEPSDLVDNIQESTGSKDAKEDGFDDNDKDDLNDSEVKKNEKEVVVTLKQRAWPLMNIMKRAQLKNVDVIWGT